MLAGKPPANLPHWGFLILSARGKKLQGGIL